MFCSLSPTTSNTSTQADEVISTYSLNITPAYYRHLIRQRFERNRHVSDPRAIDILIIKSKQDYQETMNVWKLPDQLMGVLLEPPKYVERENRTFLQKFYEGVYRCLLTQLF